MAMVTCARERRPPSVTRIRQPSHESAVRGERGSAISPGVLDGTAFASGCRIDCEARSRL
jgi:hypothetical protein